MAGHVSLAQPNVEFYWMSLTLDRAFCQAAQGFTKPITQLGFLSFPFLHFPLLFTGLDDS